MNITKIIKHPYVLTFFSVLVVLSAAIFEWFEGLYIKSPQAWTSSAFFIGFIIVTSLSVYALFSRITTQELFDEKIADIKNIIIASNMSWLVNEKYVSSLEDNASDIWVFSRGMENDIDQNGDIYKAVTKNLSLGKKYTYFLPKTTLINGAISKFHRVHTFENNQVRFCIIPEDQFLFYTEAVVYNVRDDDKKTVGIEWLPVKKLNYYVELDETHTNRLIAIGETLLINNGFKSFDRSSAVVNLQ